jgi:hypothetical protein
LMRILSPQCMPFPEPDEREAFELHDMTSSFIVIMLHLNRSKTTNLVL